ncbi:MAG TPA: cation transporter, partial [Firmicutes bacterium]|nr:cation transporter [Bacillota bacterium]
LSKDNTPASVSMLAVVAIALMALAKLFTGLLINSVALLSEGLHTLLDLFAAMVSYYTVRVSSMPADIEHRYGHGKIENAAGIAQAAFIFVPTLIIIYRAILGLTNLHTVMSKGGADIGTIVMGITMVVNLLLGLRLLNVAKAYKSEAVRAAAYHQLNDLWTSIGVFIAMALIWIKPEWKILDPLVALAVTVISIMMAWSLFRESFYNLIDKSPGIAIDHVIVEVLENRKPLVRGYHNLRTRRAGNTVYADLHVEVCGEMSFREAHEITEKIEAEIASRLEGADVIIHADPCFEDCHRCDICDDMKKSGTNPD